MVKFTGKGDINSIQLEIQLKTAKSISAFNKELADVAVGFTQSMYESLQKQKLEVERVYTNLQEGVSTKWYKNLESFTFKNNEMLLKEMFVDIRERMMFSLSETSGLLEQIMLIYNSITKDAGLTIEETYDSVLKGIEHAFERGFTLEQVFDSKMKPKELKKGIDVAYKRIAEFMKEAEIKHLANQFDVSPRTVKLKLNQVSGAGDDIEKLEKLKQILIELQPVAEEFGISLDDALKKYKDSSQDIDTNIDNVEKQVRRSIQISWSQIQDTDQLITFGIQQLKAFGTYIIGFGTIAWDVIGKLKEQINSINIALNGTAKQSAELQDNIFDIAIASNVASEKITNVATAFMSVNGQMRSGWYNSVELYASIAKLSDVFGVSKTTLGTYFGEMGALFNFTNDELDSLVQQIGSMGGLTGHQFEEMLQGVTKFQDIIVLSGGTKGLLGYKNKIDETAKSFNLFGAMAKDAGIKVFDMMEEINKLADPSKQHLTGNLLSFAGSSQLEFFKAVQNDSRKASTIFLQSIDNAAKKYDDMVKTGNNIAYKSLAEYFQTAYNINADMAVKLATQLDLYKEQHKEIKLTADIYDSFISSMIKKESLDKKYIDNLKSITKSFNTIKKVVVDIVANVIQPIEPIVSGFAVVLAKIPSGLKQSLVIAGLGLIMITKVNTALLNVWGKLGKINFSLGGFSKKIKDLSASMNGLQKSMVIITVLIMLVNVLKDVWKMTENMNTTTKYAIRALSLVGAALIAFTVIVWSFNAALLANPITWIILGIVAAVALITTGIVLLVKNWDKIWNAVKKGLTWIWDKLKLIANIMSGGLLGLFAGKKEINFNVNENRVGKPENMAQYEKGVDYVPETAPALIHRGESVINAGDNAVLRDKVSQMSKDIKEMKETIITYLPVLHSAIKRGGGMGINMITQTGKL